MQLRAFCHTLRPCFALMDVGMLAPSVMDILECLFGSWLGHQWSFVRDSAQSMWVDCGVHEMFMKLWLESS